MPRTARRWAFAAALAVASVALGAMAWRPGSLPSTEVGLMFAVPSVILIGIDWASGGFADNDFALAADIVLLLSTTGVYAVLLVLARRMASLLARDRSKSGATLASAAYVAIPPVLVSSLLTWLGLYAVSGERAFSIAVTASMGLTYVLLDATFGLMARAESPYLPWALPANVSAYGGLWLSHVSLALLGELTLPSLGLLSVMIFTLLAVLLRVAYGLVRRVTRLYAATAEALAAALEVAMPEADRRTRRLAALAGSVSRALGFPEQDAALVESGAWLRSIIGQGLASRGDAGVLSEEHVALADSLRVAEAVDAPGAERSQRFRNLGLVLHEVADSDRDPMLGGLQPAPNEFAAGPRALTAVRDAVTCERSR